MANKKTVGEEEIFKTKEARGVQQEENSGFYGKSTGRRKY